MPKAVFMFEHAALLSVTACRQVSSHLQQHSCNSPSCTDALMIRYYGELSARTSSEGKGISQAAEQMLMQKLFVDFGNTVEPAAEYYSLTRGDKCRKQLM